MKRHIQFKTDAEMVCLLDQEAVRLETNRSHVIRKALEQYFATKGVSNNV